VRTEPIEEYMKIDIYSMAMTIYELLVNRFLKYDPEVNVATDIFMKKVVKGYRPGLDDPGLDEYEKYKPIKTLLKSAWDEDPKKRPDLSAFLE
jgi:serine/threonine protein kinase